MKYPRILIAIFALLLSLSTLTSAQDPGWPRQIAKPGGILIVHQPQVDEWKEFKNLTWRQAFEMTPTGGKPVIGAATLTGATIVDQDQRTVVVQDIQVTNTYFPSLDPNQFDQMAQLFKSFLPPAVNVSYARSGLRSHS